MKASDLRHLRQTLGPPERRAGRPRRAVPVVPTSVEIPAPLYDDIYAWHRAQGESIHALILRALRLTYGGKRPLAR